MVLFGIRLSIYLKLNKTMKKVWFLALCLIATAVSKAQVKVLQVKQEGAKEWFYVKPNGEKILAQGYEKGYTFSPDGYAPVFDAIKKEFYFINIKGEVLKTEIQGFRIKEGFGFDITGFEDGMVAVKKDGKWGYLNTDGKLVFPLKYSGITEFNGGYAVAEIDKTTFILEKSGKETQLNNPAIASVRKFSEGMAPFVGTNKMLGFINTSGNIVVEAKYLSVGYFQNGVAWVKTIDKKVGFINQKGEWVLEPNFLSGSEFEKESGLAKVKRADETVVLINIRGQVIEVKDADTYSDFSEGYAYAKKGGKVGFIDNTGNWVIQPQFDAVRDFKNGYAAAKMGDLWGLIDKSGKWVIQPQYGSIRDVVELK